MLLWSFSSCDFALNIDSIDIAKFEYLLQTQIKAHACIIVCICYTCIYLESTAFKSQWCESIHNYYLI